MPENDITIEVTDKFTEDVRKGLKLFYEQTPDAVYSSLPGEWEYWFLNNPYGNGLYSMARDHEKVIGFCALIPIEMVVDRKIVKGAKAEFLFVLPEFRKRAVKDSAKSVSVSLLSELYQKSFDYGINLIFGIATKAAEKAHLKAGKKPMNVDTLRYFTFFKPREFNEFGAMKNLAAKYGTHVTTGIMRKRLSFIKGSRNLILGSTSEIKKINPGDFSKNQLLYHDRRMLNFRFTPEDSLIYELGNSQNDFLIFSKPYRNAKVALRHWSNLNIPEEFYVSVFKDIFQKCISCGAASLNLVFSGSSVKTQRSFTKFGFMKNTSQDVILLYHSNPDIKLSFNQNDWYFTDSHRGFI